MELAKLCELMGVPGDTAERSAAKRRLGSLLLEQVVAIGVLGLLLLVVAAATIQTGRGGNQSRRTYEAECLAHNLLETQMTRAVTLIPLTPQAPLNGKFGDGSSYQSVVQGFSLGGVGPAAGLTDNEIRGVRVSVTWKDQTGDHQTRAEGYVVKVPQ